MIYRVSVPLKIEVGFLIVAANPEDAVRKVERIQAGRDPWPSAMHENWEHCVFDESECWVVQAGGKRWECDWVDGAIRWVEVGQGVPSQ